MELGEAPQGPSHHVQAVETCRACWQHPRTCRTPPVPSWPSRCGYWVVISDHKPGGLKQQGRNVLALEAQSPKPGDCLLQGLQVEAPSCLFQGLVLRWPVAQVTSYQSPSLPSSEFVCSFFWGGGV